MMKWVTDKRCKWCGVRLYWFQVWSSNCEVCRYQDIRSMYAPDARWDER